MKFSSTPLTINDLSTLAPSALASQAHESRSERYGFRSTTEVISMMESEGFRIFSASQSRTRRGDRVSYLKHMLRFRHESSMDLSMVGDLVPELVLVNSMDGSSAYKLMAGIFRMVCSNGMVVADSMIQSIRVRHTATTIQDVLQASRTITKQTNVAIEAIDTWRALQLSDGEQNALATAAHHMRFADTEGHVNTPITPLQLLHIRREADRGNDLWSIHNRIQENVIKGGLTARTIDSEGNRGRRIATREVKEISADVKLNQALWTLSEEMAKLKR